MKKTTKIDELPQGQLPNTKLRVAAYARVSTDSDEQLESLKAQREHYKRYIKSNPEWEFAGHISAWVVPGSRPVKRAAEKMGIAQQFIDAGFEWREPGCSACISMNADRVPPKTHCASTTNRNFEGRQGKDARTHLCSPAMAVLAAVKGYFYDTRLDDREVPAL